jgi:tellurite methyltransferase
LNQSFDVVLLNVVLQFIDKEAALNLIEKAKQHTKPGGLHSITCPVVTPGMHWPEKFKCVLQPEQLKNCYVNDGWAILEYNEDFGHLHVLDDAGLPKRGRFASIICQKTHYHMRDLY